MGNPYFQFKQFTVYHDQCAMKVGVDGTLLGAWTKVSNATSVLDVGTGSGLVALMIAQRTEASVTGIDIDEYAVKQASENIEASKWHHRIKIMHISLSDFATNSSERFDLIVSNPPYFNDSLKAPDEKRTLARHTDSLSHPSLLTDGKHLLSDQGRICLILPFQEEEEILNIASQLELYCTALTRVFPKPNHPPKRILIEFSKQHLPLITSELTIETENRHTYTSAYTELMKNYYLKM